MITSRANAQMKYLVRLQEKGSARREDRVYVCEGRKLFREVLQYARGSIVKAYFSESFYEQWKAEGGEALLEGVARELVADAVFAAVSGTVTPQGVLAVVRQPEYSMEDMLKGDSVRLLLLENLRDPGNLGTILRTAEGAGMDGVILSRESVDLFNPKVIRSTMGAIYRMPFYYAPDFYGMLQELARCGVTVFAAHLEGSEEYDAVRFPQRTALLIGNEANGLTEQACRLAAGRLRIPMEGSVESLNAAVAAALLMYETYRQARGRSVFL